MRCYDASSAPSSQPSGESRFNELRANLCVALKCLFASCQLESQRVSSTPSLSSLQVALFTCHRAMPVVVDRATGFRIDMPAMDVRPFFSAMRLFQALSSRAASGTQTAASSPARCSFARLNALASVGLHPVARACSGSRTAPRSHRRGRGPRAAAANPEPHGPGLVAEAQLPSDLWPAARPAWRRSSGSGSVKDAEAAGNAPPGPPSSATATAIVALWTSMPKPLSPPLDQARSPCRANACVRRRRPTRRAQPSMGACRGAGRPSQPANIGSKPQFVAAPRSAARIGGAAPPRR